MRKNYILPLVLALDILILLYETSTLSISYFEAHTYFGHHGVVGFISNIAPALFGQNDYTLRIAFILLHTATAFLVYLTSGYFLKTTREQNLLVVVFLLLPGVMSSALLVNKVGVVIFLTFLFVYLYYRFQNNNILNVFLLFLAPLDNSFSYLFLGIFLYAVTTKQKNLALSSVFFIAINLFIFGSDIGGYPTGHFLDALGVYAAIFSPVVFVYIVYILYRHYLTKEFNILWFIATTPLVFSLLLSLRQRVHIEFYAPFVLVALFLAAKQFNSSYKVRLVQFRKGYKLLFNIALFFLVVHFFLILANKSLYNFIEKPKHHFAYKNHVAKELAKNLKTKHIPCVNTNYQMQLRLKFYGITECKKYKLKYFKEVNAKDVTVRYNSKIIYPAYVTKINNQ